MKEIIWKRNGNGEDAFVGSIKIGSYWHNGIDPKNGTYKVTSCMPQNQLNNVKVFDIDEAKNIVKLEFESFVKKMSK